MATLATEIWTGTTGAAWPAQWTTGVSGTGSSVMIDTNRGKLVSTGTGTFADGNYAYLSSMAASADFDITVDVTFPSPTTNQFLSIWGRATSAPTATTPPTSGYRVVIAPTEPSLYIRKQVSGASTDLSNPVTTAWTADVARRVRFQGIGSTLQVKIWDPAGAEPGTWLSTVTDTAVTAAGRVAFKHFNGSAGGNVTAYVDDLTVTDGVAPADTTAPTVPTGVTATANSPTQVTVSWTASTDAVGVASYRVRRGGVDVSGATAVTGTSFVNTGLTASTAYSFTVSAVDAAGNRSAESTAATVTTPATVTVPAMPNQISGSLYRTTMGGTNVFRYEVRTSTDSGLTTGEKQAYVYVPSNRVGQASAKMVFGGPGLGDDGSTFMQDPGSLPLLDLLADAGYVVIVPNYEQTYGNDASQSRLLRAYTYLTQTWTSLGQFLLGFSRGSAISAVAMHKDTLPNVRAIQLIAPIVHWASFAPESSGGAIYTAYGVAVGNAAAFATATAAWDPSRQPASEYAGQRWRLSSSPDDSHVTIRPRALEFLTYIGGVAAQAIDVPVTGAHDAASEWAGPADIVAFFEAASLARVTDRWNGTALVRQQSDRWTGAALVPQVLTP